MAERSIMDQLDDAVTAMVDGRQADTTTSDLLTLIGVARDLVGLPRETFKANLQEQFKRRDAMSSPAPQIEENAVRSMSLYICVANASAAIDFYQRAFGAKELSRLAEPDGRIGHAELQISNTVLMISD